jgi:hypothetical protein
MDYLLDFFFALATPGGLNLPALICFAVPRAAFAGLVEAGFPRQAK